MKTIIYLLDPRGADLQEAFKFVYIRLSPIRSFVSYSANIPRTTNMLTDSGPPKKLLLWGLVRGAPNPLNPSEGVGDWNIFERLLLMDYSDHHRVKYFCEALDFKYHLGYSCGVPQLPFLAIFCKFCTTSGKFMVYFGYFWLILATFGYFWLFLATFSYCWILLATFGYFRLLLTTFDYFWLNFGYFWLLMATYGFFWLHLATFG